MGVCVCMRVCACLYVCMYYVCMYLSSCMHMNASIRVRTYTPEHTQFQAIQGYSRLHVHTIPGHFRGIGRSSKVGVGGANWTKSVCGGGVGPVRQPVARIFFWGGGAYSGEEGVFLP